MKRSTWFPVLVGLLLLPGGVRAAEEKPFELRDGDRVVLIGGTFIEREQSYSYLETLFHVAWPERKFTVRNLGWSGDNVFGASRGYFEGADAGFARLTKIVHELKPTVIVIGYGMTESFEGEAGLPQFRAGLSRLLDMLKDLNARETILIGPIRHEQFNRPLPDPTEHNRSIALYANAIKDIAATRGHRFIDLQDLTAGAASLTDNGIHLTRDGYLAAGQSVMKKLGLPIPTASPEISEKIRRLSIQKNVQFFNQWRPANETYIFGFRAYEQGKNAVEMPQFAKPIEKLEDEINTLAKSIKK
jgi:hypothetical protein